MKHMRIPSGKDSLYLRQNAAEDEVAVVIMATGGSAKGSRGDTWTRLPDLFALSGISSFVFDFSGQGESTGDRPELTISKGVKNLSDVLDFIDPKIDGRKHFLLGSSFGGNVVLEYLSRDFDHLIQGAALKSPCIDLRESYFQDLGHVGMRDWKERGYSETTGLNWEVMEDSDMLNLRGRLGAISCPLLITHGTADESVPIEQSRAVIAQSGGEAQIFEIKGCNHHYSEANHWRLMAEVMRTWILSLAEGDINNGKPVSY